MSIVNSNGARSCREQRMYRLAIISALSELLESMPKVSIDASNWAKLDQLPDWWLSEQCDIQVLAELCGALHYQEFIKRSINGEFLREVRRVIGVNLFREIQELPAPQTEPAYPPEFKCTQELLLRAGCSILLGTIEDKEIREVIMNQKVTFMNPLETDNVEVSDHELAKKKYKTAIQLILKERQGGGVIGTGQSQKSLEHQITESGL